MVKQYNADSIQVLSGLDPVKKRPGMFTDTSCPNHLIEIFPHPHDDPPNRFVPDNRSAAPLMQA